MNYNRNKKLKQITPETCCCQVLVGGFSGRRKPSLVYCYSNFQITLYSYQNMTNTSDVTARVSDDLTLSLRGHEFLHPGPYPRVSDRLTSLSCPPSMSSLQKLV